MDYTVEFDSKLLEQFPQEVHLAYKKLFLRSHRAYVDHNFFSYKTNTNTLGKGNI